MARIIPPPRVPVIDQRTGMMAQAWYAFFAQYLQEANNTIMSLDGDVEGLVIDNALATSVAAIDEISKRVADLETDFRPDPTAELDELRRRIAALETELAQARHRH
jgi:prefoldin subunit 5